MLIPPITFIEIDESVTFLPNPLIIKIVYENFLQTTSAVYAIILENVSGSVLAHVLRIMPPPLKNGWSQVRVNNDKWSYKVSAVA